MCTRSAHKSIWMYFGFLSNNLTIRYCTYSLFLITCIINFTSCGGANEELELAPERPLGTIIGRIHDGSANEATVTAYTFASIDNREYLGKAHADENGEFELKIQAPSQIVLLEVEAKSYTESSSKSVINVDEKHKLTGLLAYESGKHHVASVTPFSHLISALAKYNYDQGEEASVAFENANKEFESLYDLPITITLPVNDKIINDDLPDSNEEILYGLLLAGLSELTKNISQASEPKLHETLNSWHLSQLLYNDILSDGIIDGKWRNNESVEENNINFGNAAVNAKLLQQDLAAASLNTEIYDSVKQKLDLNIIEDFVLKFSSRGSAILSSIESKPLNSPTIKLKNTLKAYYAGDITLSVEVNGILKLKEINFFIDNVQINNSESDIYTTEKIDSAAYSDGKHALTIIAIDEFGNEGSALFDIVFDNTSPTIEILSPLKTNQANYRLKGVVSDGGSGVKELLINQNNAVISDDNNWFIDLEIKEGENQIQLTIIDKTDNEFVQDFNLILDTVAPVIDSFDKHSEATFVIENNNFMIDALRDANNLPVSLGTDNLSLNGAAISFSTLQDKAIPYFSFTVTDPLSEDHATPLAMLQIKIRIEKNAAIIRDWFDLKPNGDQFYAPLIREIIGEEIDNAKVSDKFIIRLMAKDEAGNESRKLFEFSAALFPTAQEVTLTQTAIDESWKNTKFQNRSQLYDREIPALHYEYVNTSESVIYLKLSEINENRVIQTYEQVNRENKVRLKMIPLWRIGKVDNPRKTCPQFDGNWQPVNQIFNYTTQGIWQEQRPQIVVSELLSFAQDTVVPMANTPWLDLPDFDDAYEVIKIETDAGDVLTYEHDYLVDTSISGMSQPALLANWQASSAANDKTILCNNVRNIQTMEKYEYLQEPGYPRNVISEQTHEETFQTSKFKVFDEDGSELVGNKGWYKVPALHKVLITKFVTTASLTTYNSEFVSTPDLVKDYEPHKLDTRVTWLVSQSLAVEFAHDLNNLINDVVLSKEIRFNNDVTNFTLARE